MRKLIFLSFTLFTAWCSFSQDSIPLNVATGQNRKQDPVTLHQLNRVTVGFGIGPSAMFNCPTDPFLAPGTDELQLQLLERYSLVISTIFTVKFGKYGATEKGLAILTNPQTRMAEKPNFWDRLTINFGLNLVESDLTTIGFNKGVDGGLGLGYMVGEDINLTWFFDFSSHRQLRKFIIENYEGKKIPDGSGFFNALDTQDNDLFYSKRFLGTSLKLVFTLGNRKKQAPETAYML